MCDFISNLFNQLKVAFVSINLFFYIVGWQLSWRGNFLVMPTLIRRSTDLSFVSFKKKARTKKKIFKKTFIDCYVDVKAAQNEEAVYFWTETLKLPFSKRPLFPRKSNE
jgi:hypothetical protein